MTMTTQFAPDDAPELVHRRAANLAGDPKTDIALEWVDGDVWDECAAKFDGICQEQLHAFASTHWPNVKQEPILFRVKSELVGGVLMMVQRLPLSLGAIAIAKWGPVFADNGNPDRETIYAAMVEALVQEYADKRGMMLSIMPRAAKGEVNPSYAFLKARGFHNGSELGFPNRYVVNLRLADDEQRKSLAQKWRYHLRKSEKAVLSFEHAGVAQFSEFSRLYALMSDRKRFLDHSAYETVDELMHLPDPLLRPELFFVRHQGEVVAGAIVFKAGDTAVYLYGATSDAALPLRAGYFIHWHIIGWLRDNTSANWYDLGGTDGFQGLHQFKKGMVGTAGFIAPVPPVMNYAATKRAYWVGRGAFAVRDALTRFKMFANSLKRGVARPDQGR